MKRAAATIAANIARLTFPEKEYKTVVARYAVPATISKPPVTRHVARIVLGSVRKSMGWVDRAGGSGAPPCIPTAMIPKRVLRV
jgi:hypothetical protein